MMVGIATKRATAIEPVTPLASSQVPNDPPENCPATRPPTQPFVPPAPYSARPPDPDMFWFGTEKLWTMLPVNATWRGLRHYSPTTPGFRQKIFWWRNGYFWLTDPEPKLMVKGRRIDGRAPPFVIPKRSRAYSRNHATNGYQKDFKSFMLVGADIPTHGCWEITGRYKGDELTFIIWVAP